MSNELNKMIKKRAVQMKDRTFNGKDPMSIIVFLQDFKAACNAYRIQEGAAMWIYEQYLSGRVESVIKARVALPTKTA